jgi:hypothetical protein
VENNEIYDCIVENLGEDFTLYKYEGLKYMDKCYIDSTKKKYILICKVFDNIEELKSNWEQYQDEDVAIYMQNSLFKNDDIRWDMYLLLIYKGMEKLNYLESYKIEKDRFCCKKIILKAQTRIFFENELKQKLPMMKFYTDYTEAIDVADDKIFLDLMQKELDFDIRETLNILKYNSES